jgi:hypothetical protein
MSETMPQLEWDELEFLECLEVVPEEEDYSVRFIYQIERGDQRLLLTVRPWESVIELALFCGTGDTPLIQFVLFVRRCVRAKKEKWGEYLVFEDCVIGPSRF